MGQVIYVDLRLYYGLVKVSGPDAGTFLQGQLTCDIQKVSTDLFQLGGHCNPKGRLRSLFRIYKYHDAFYLQAPKLQIDFAIAELKKYAKFSKVSITDERASLGTLGLINLGNGLANPFLDAQLKRIQTLLSESTLNFDNADLQIIKIPHSSNRYQVIGPNAVLENILNHLPKTQMQSFESWKLADIQDGLPEVWPELSEQLLPHNIQLPKLGGVSFNKGCYCGQEIIARMEYRGNIKKTMVRASIEGLETILPGTLVYAKDANNKQTEIGLVITSAKIENHTTEMLLEISKEFISSDDIPKYIFIGSIEETPLRICNCSRLS